MLRSEGSRVSFLQIQSLFPIPRRSLDRATKGVKAVCVAEENLTGQYRAALTPFLSGKRIYGINKIGSLISPREITRAVREVMA
jgi:pyruvate/2-oxoacid:ferredoxin oxidoreductase alpha subunit